MKYTTRKRKFSKVVSVFLIAYTVASNTLTAFATDFNAEAEARKGLAIQSNSIENWPSGPAIGAEGAILMEANTGTILYAKNIHEHLYPASTTKILTALVAAENSSMDDDVTYSHEAVFSIERGSSNMGMDVGEVITMEQSLYGLLVNSANEAANAIAEHVAGDIPSFVDMMNAKAKELGCKDSNFVTTNGLHDDNHYTSPYDLALIAKAFFDNELLAKMSGTATYYIPQSPTQPDDDLYCNTHNKMLISNKYKMDSYIGGKTGYTTVARQTLVSCAQQDGMKLICVIMKEESPNQFQDTVDLFNYGFENFQIYNVSENETKYTMDNSDFFTTDNDIFGNSKPILSLNTEDCIVLPKTALFSDAQSELSYDSEKEPSVATISYTYNRQPVGQATIDLAYIKDEIFDFSSLSVNDTETEIEGNKENVIFVNVKKIILWVLGISGILILLFILFSFIRSYSFNRKRRTRRKSVTLRKQRRRPKRRRRNYYYDDDRRGWFR
ncbi:MAG: D-alanyl-D-alanine carboxypeptidase [Clostridiales bacterium]|nr:D-alanyl-D-alanine carboxypeptidase [Clostridiales bacterium]